MFAIDLFPLLFRFCTCRRLQAFLLSTLILPGAIQESRADEEPTAQNTKFDVTPIVNAIALAELPSHSDTPGRLATAKQELQWSADQLQQWLGPFSPNGAKWNRYLLWDLLAAELASSSQEASEKSSADAKDATDRASRKRAAVKRRAELAKKRERLEKLYRVRDRVNADMPGLEFAPFRRFAAKLQEYIDAFLDDDLPDKDEAYQSQLTQLRKELTAYSTQPTAKRSFTIGQRLEYLSAIRDDAQLASAIDQVLRRPNVFLEVNDRFLNLLASRPISDTGPVSDVILGTQIRGTATTRGHVSLKTIASNDRATIEFESTGNSRATTRGVNGPAIINSSSVTRFNATKRVELTDPVFRVMPSQATATTRSKIKSVQGKQGGLIGLFVGKIASKRVYQSQGQADAIAAKKAETRIRSEFDEEVLASVQQLRRSYRDQFRYRFLRQNAYPTNLSLRTSQGKLHVSYSQASRGQLAASNLPPAPWQQNDILLRMHQSAITNYLTMYGSALTIEKKTAAGELIVDGNLPDWLRDAFAEYDRRAPIAEQTGVDRGESPPSPSSQQPDGPTLLDPSSAVASGERIPKKKGAPAKFQPWKMTFRRAQPITVEMKKQRLVVTLHAETIASGKDKFSGWDLQAQFSVVGDHGTLLFRREGDIEVFPTSFDPDLGGKISSRLLPVRSNLMKLINELGEQGDGIPEEIKVPRWEFRGELAHLPAPSLETWDLSSGWLTLGWQAVASF